MKVSPPSAAETSSAYSRRVDHGAGEGGLPGGMDRQAVATDVTAVDAGAGQQRHLARRARPRRGAYVGLGFHDSRRRRPDGRRRLDVRLAPADEGAVDRLEVGHPVGVSSMPAARGTVSSTASGCRGSGAGGAKPCGTLAASASCFFYRCIVPPGLPACFRAASLLPGRGHARRERRGATGRLFGPPRTWDLFLLGLGSGRLPDTLRGAHRMAPTTLLCCRSRRNGQYDQLVILAVSGLHRRTWRPARTRTHPQILLTRRIGISDRFRPESVIGLPRYPHRDRARRTGLRLGRHPRSGVMRVECRDGLMAGTATADTLY